MLNKAATADHNLRTYTTLDQLGLSGAVTMEQVCTALPECSALQMRNSLGYNTKITDAPATYTLITIHTDILGYTHCEAWDTVDKVLYQAGYRPNTTPAFSGWSPIATATPPNWHDAPLETGWSWTAQGRYGKDGSGTGYLVGAVNKASAPLSSEAILRLPAGYRPPVLWPVNFSSAQGTDGSSWATYGYLWPDGYLRFHGGALPANYSPGQGIAFAVEFPTV